MKIKANKNYHNMVLVHFDLLGQLDLLEILIKMEIKCLDENSKEVELRCNLFLIESSKTLIKKSIISGVFEPCNFNKIQFALGMLDTSFSITDWGTISTNYTQSTKALAEDILKSIKAAQKFKLEV